MRSEEGCLVLPENGKETFSNRNALTILGHSWDKRTVLPPHRSVYPRSIDTPTEIPGYSHPYKCSETC